MEDHGVGAVLLRANRCRDVAIAIRFRRLVDVSTYDGNRTDVSRYNHGPDADGLNKTLGGPDRIMSEAISART
jgi:hypothetical protein